jgi:hypothetical protein
VTTVRTLAPDVVPTPADTPTETPVDIPDRLPVESAAVRATERPTRLRAWAARASALLGDPSVPLVLTLVLVMLATSQKWYVAVPAVVLGTVGIVVPGVRSSGRFWLALAAVLGAAAWSDRWRVDNHQFLIAYWCLAVGLAALGPDPVRVRRISARLLVGVVFLLAVTWKLLAPDFVDGSFMRYTLLTDTRFSEVTTLVGGVSSQDLTANRDALGLFDRPDASPAAVPLRSTDRLDLVAMALTWWTLAIEGAVALLFLVPWRRLARHRDVALITFVLTTYAVAPVVGFGWILVCLGLVQREPARRLVPVAYVGAFLAVQVFTAPWTSVAGFAA